jgi:hypothetical protein
VAPHSASAANRIPDCARLTPKKENIRENPKRAIRNRRRETPSNRQFGELG